MFYVPEKPEEDKRLLQPASPEAGEPSVEDGRTCVAALRAAGAPAGEILHKLAEMGLDAETAHALVTEQSSPAARRRKRKRPLFSDEADAGHTETEHEDVEVSQPSALPAIYASALQQAGQRNMLIGGLVCVVGLVVTLGTLAISSGPGGGSYIIAWGAIVFGVIQFFRGCSQVAQARQQ